MCRLRRSMLKEPRNTEEHRASFLLQISRQNHLPCAAVTCGSVSRRRWRGASARRSERAVPTRSAWLGTRLQRFGAVFASVLSRFAWATVSTAGLCVSSICLNVSQLGEVVEVDEEDLQGYLREDASDEILGLQQMVKHVLNLVVLDRPAEAPAPSRTLHRP